MQCRVCFTRRGDYDACFQTAQWIMFKTSRAVARFMNVLVTVACYRSWGCTVYGVAARSHLLFLFVLRE